MGAVSVYEKRAKVMERITGLLASVSLVALMAGQGPALAQEASEAATDAEATATIESTAAEGVAVPTLSADARMTIISERDKADFLELEPDDLLFGLDKPLLEVGRSATFVSDTTLERYAIEDISDLVSIAPNTYTASYYGIEGQVNVRGTLAENYFRGFKRIENQGTFPTPLGASSRIDIVRGPPTPNLGAGKIGGLLNFMPKTAKREGDFIEGVTGNVKGSIGSYGYGEASGEIAVPVTMGYSDGGVFLYGEIKNDSGYYENIDPKEQMVQAAFDLDIDSNWSVAAGGMFFHASNYLQSPGQNRLTQDLIDNQIYITGRDTDIVDSNGDGRYDPSEAGVPPLTAYQNGPVGTPGSLVNGFFAPYTGDPRFQLDTDVGTSKIGRRNVFYSDADMNSTHTGTLYADLVYEFLSGDKFLLQAFYDNLEHERFVSYGFAAEFNTNVFETRATYDFDYTPTYLPAVMNGNVGASFRLTNANDKQSYNSGYLVSARRDLEHGATATDTYIDPFNYGPMYPWETALDSTIKDYGLFLNTETTLWDMLSISFGGRYDLYKVRSKDNGIASVCFCPTGEYTAGQGSWTYTASGMLMLPFGVRPYVTYAETNALELGQAGGISTTLVQDGAWLSDGELLEAGFKWELFDAALTGSFAAYRQERTQTDQFSNVSNTVGKGLETEFRWLATENISFSGSAAWQQTKVDPNQFFNVSAQQLGQDPIDSYGGAFATFTLANWPERTEPFIDTRKPRVVWSLFGNYTSDNLAVAGRDTYWGATAGLTYVDITKGVLPDSVTFPEYYLVNASAFFQISDVTLSLQATNLLNELYYTQIGTLYSEVFALPGRGREVRASLEFEF